MGYDVEAWGFDNNLYTINADKADFRINRFKKIKSYNKIVNFILACLSIAKLVKKSFKKGNLVYFFGFDVTLYAWLFTKLYKKRYIYEQSDITYASRNRLLVKILSKIDYILRKKALMVIFTSEGFVKYFYKDNVPSNILIQPNKLHSSLSEVRRVPLYLASNEHIRFGFIGLIRYETIFNFANVIGKYFPQHEFHFCGDVGHKTKDKIDYLINNYKNIFSHGAFSNPSDLSKVYSNVDVVVCCYDTLNFNTKYAEPNKIYEAMFFCKPIIVSHNTYLAHKVSELAVGCSVDASNEHAIKCFVEALDMEQINNIINKESTISTLDLIDDDSLIRFALSKNI